MAATNKKNKYAYTTLITKPSYLAGVIILAYTLRKQNSQYPLVVLYTDALTKDSVTALQNESEKLNLVLKKTEALLPRSDVKITLIAERFGDTWYVSSTPNLFPSKDSSIHFVGQNYDTSN